MTCPAPTTDRVITGAQMREARAWTEQHRGWLEVWTCAERVLAVAGVLVTTDDRYDVAELQAAIRDVDTVDWILDLLTELGVGCGV